MCCRYYVDDKTIESIRRLVRELDRRIHEYRGDIHPAESAPVIKEKNGILEAIPMEWGFCGSRNKQLLINARAESVLEKPTFRDSIRTCRCVIPASGFYEWDRSRQKATFTLPEKQPFFLAGCYRQEENGDHFVVITTNANKSMQPVHDRMPLILTSNEVSDWILDPRATEDLLRSPSPELNCFQEYRQLRLFP